MVVYNKLVRDRIPKIIRENGERPVICTLRAGEFKKALKEKLLKEVREIESARSKELLVEELADVQEVLIALYDAYGIACQDVTKAARAKRKTRGAFTRRIFLKEVE